MTDKQDKSYLYTKDQEGFAVMKTKDQLTQDDIIISKEEYEKICGEPMTKNNEQIIIDGVDVRGCMYFTKITAFQSNCIINGFADCSKKPECYYKLWKRKEQECEELKDELLMIKCMITTQGMENGRLYEQIYQLKKENEELKEELQKYINREQREAELAKKRADGFKEMRKMLYGKVDGSSLIERRNPYEN